MTSPQMTPANRQEREANGENGPVNRAKRVKTADSTHISNMFFEQGSDEELQFFLLASVSFREPGVWLNARLIIIVVQTARNSRWLTVSPPWAALCCALWHIGWHPKAPTLWEDP